MVNAEDRDDTCDTEISAETLLDNWSISVIVEKSPLSLARVYGFLATLNTVPLSTRSTLQGDDAMVINLSFVDIDAITADRICRKVSQLTEMIRWHAP